MKFHEKSVKVITEAKFGRREGDLVILALIL